jgi:hypothetical protein
MTAITLSWSQKLRTRIPSWSHYLSAVAQDRRQAVYRLLPLLTSHRQRQLASRLWAWTQPRSAQTGPLAPAVATWLKVLGRDGVVTDMPSIAPESLAEIVGYFKSIPCHDPYRPHLGQFRWDAVPAQETNMGMYTDEQIVRAPQVLELFNHPLVLQLAEAYIGCKPTLDNIGCWWSYSGRSMAKGTQKFHRDFDSLAGFKIFFYLTDVGSAQGPHEYIRESHRSKALGTGAAIPDETLWQHYEDRQALLIEGAAGSSFIADTFGIHRGRLPKSGSRLLLSAQYNVNVSPHGPKEPFQMSGRLPLDHFINRLYVK